MAIALRACLGFAGAGLLACSTAMADDAPTVQVTTGAVLSQDMHLANSLLSDEKIVYTTADRDGSYRLRKAPNAAWETLSRDDFLSYARSQLVGRTTISPLDYDDGWRVRYMAPDGQIYVWDGQSQFETRGTWTIAIKTVTVAGKPVQVVQTCSTIDADLRLLDRRPSTFYCYPTAHDFAYPEDAAETGRETREGDPFGLAQGRKPEIKSADIRPQWPDEVKQ